MNNIEYIDVNFTVSEGNSVYLFLKVAFLKLQSSSFFDLALDDTCNKGKKEVTIVTLYEYIEYRFLKVHNCYLLFF